MVEGMPAVVETALQAADVDDSLLEAADASMPSAEDPAEVEMLAKEAASGLNGDSNLQEVDAAEVAEDEGDVEPGAHTEAEIEEELKPIPDNDEDAVDEGEKGREVLDTFQSGVPSQGDLQAHTASALSHAKHSKAKKKHKGGAGEDEADDLPRARRMPLMGSENRTDKVAFLFLTRGRMPFEKAWTKFFSQDTLGRHTIFVHAPTSYTYKATSIWHGRTIPHQSVRDVMWGEPSMVEAEKVLLQFAIQDPGVAKFALLSELDVPVQSFECTHQMITEKKQSFLQSVQTQDRMPPKLKTYVSPRMWRKGSQWFVLNREHAQMVLDDRDYWTWFRRFCTIFSLNPCIADEHYIPTLLALRKAESQSQLLRHSLTYTQWIEGKPSPELFGKNTPMRSKIQEIRRCHYVGASHSKKVLFPVGAKERCGERLDEEAFGGLGNPNEMGTFEVRRPCYAFARKFAAELSGRAASLVDTFL